jgi:O-antigen ligase
MVQTKQRVKKNKSNEEVDLTKVLIGCAIVTLYFNPGLQDPFNSPKMWITFALAAWCFPRVVNLQPGFVNQMKSLIRSQSGGLTIAFVISLFLSAISNGNYFTSFFGASGRRSGFLTYLSLSIIFLTVAKYATFKSNIFYNAILLVSIFISSYAYLQSTGQDFVNWNNPYNSIIVTLGNPNFASALMAVLSSILIGSCFDKKRNIYLKLFSFTLSLLMLFLVYKSDSRQGLLAFFIAFAIQISVLTYYKSKVFGLTLMGLSSVVGLLGILAMLQIGPLVDLIYKRSVSVRGYYWRAAIEMFQDFPIFGVGLDRYGAFFKEYREVEYSLNFGFVLTSTNAHNVFLQLFATGGMLVGLSYLLLMIYIGICGLKLIAISEPQNRAFVVTIFSSWMAYQAQSVISIDNLGLTVWGWVLGGLLVGLWAKAKSSSSVQGADTPTIKIRSSAVVRTQLTSYILVFIVVIMCSFLYRAEILALQQRIAYNPTDASSQESTLQLGNEMKASILVDPDYRFMSANYLSTSGYVTEGFFVLDQLIKDDPRNLDYLNARAGFAEQLMDYKKAIEIRLAIYKFDPWNARNLVTLSQDYIKENDLVAAKKYLDLILSFASSDPISDEVRNILNSL